MGPTRPSGRIDPLVARESAAGRSRRRGGSRRIGRGEDTAITDLGDFCGQTDDGRTTDND